MKRVVSYTANPEKTEFDDLKQTLHYAENESKTSISKESFCFVSGINCRAERAYEEMRAVKEQFGKSGGNVAYHCYQSFKPGEVTPEQCHEIGVKLARQLWGNKYQILVSTHLDKEHLHNHLVLNSVSFVDGKKFNCTKRSYYDLRNMSDGLCQQHGLSIVKNPKGKTPRSIYFAEKNGEPTKYNLMREAIDTALKISSTPQDFRQAMRDMGYILGDDTKRKYATLYRIGDKKSVRLYRLGENYDLPVIRERLYENRYKYGRYLYSYSTKKKTFCVSSKRYVFHGRFQNVKKITGFYALYLHYCYLLGKIPKRKNPPRPLSPQLREAARCMNEITASMRLICREKMQTTDDVAAFVEKKSVDIHELTHKRQKLYNRLRRCVNPQEILQIKLERDEITKKLVALRKEIRVAQSIPEKVPLIKEDIRAEVALRAERREQVQQRSAKNKRRERDYER